MSKELDNKYEELKLAQARLKELQFDRDNFEKEVTDEQYDEMLDERYGDVEIAGCSFSTSYALKELDPTAYNCGKNDYEDGLDPEDFAGYVDITDEIEELEGDISDLEDEIESLEAEEEDN